MNKPEDISQYADRWADMADMLAEGRRARGECPTDCGALLDEQGNCWACTPDEEEQTDERQTV